MTATFYRLGAPIVTRLVGLSLVALAVLLFASTAVVALAGLSPDLLLVGVAVVLLGVLTLAWWLRSRAWVLRCTEGGYRVRLVRGAGTTQARWRDVEDAVAVTRRGTACVELRLRDGRTTTIPVAVLAVDRDEFVHDLQAHLQRGHGLRPA